MITMEKDNRGVRHDSAQKAIAYWMVERRQSGSNAPFVMYDFPSPTAATEALLELSCIQRASDTGNLICTELLIFGCYQTDSGHWEAVVCGDSMTRGLWHQAHEAFEKHGGTRKNDRRPQDKQTLVQHAITPSFLSVWDCADREKVRAYVEAGGDINARDSDRLTLLHLAATTDLLDATRNLLEFGADPDLPAIPGHSKRTIDVVRANAVAYGHRHPNAKVIEHLLLRSG